MLAGHQELVRHAGSGEQELAVESDHCAWLSARDLHVRQLRVEELAIRQAPRVHVGSEWSGAIRKASLEVVSRLDGLVEVDQAFHHVVADRGIVPVLDRFLPLHKRLRTARFRVLVVSRDVKLTCDCLLALGYPRGPGSGLIVLRWQRRLRRRLGMRVRRGPREHARERPGKCAAETDSDQCPPRVKPCAYIDHPYKHTLCPDRGTSALMSGRVTMMFAPSTPIAGAVRTRPANGASSIWQAAACSGGSGLRMCMGCAGRRVRCHGSAPQ